jgi:hypothetical protein
LLADDVRARVARVRSHIRAEFEAAGLPEFLQSARSRALGSGDDPLAELPIPDASSDVLPVPEYGQPHWFLLGADAERASLAVRPAPRVTSPEKGEQGTTAVVVALLAVLLSFVCLRPLSDRCGRAGSWGAAVALPLAAAALSPSAGALVVVALVAGRILPP